MNTQYDITVWCTHLHMRGHSQTINNSLCSRNYRHRTDLFTQGLSPIQWCRCDESPQWLFSVHHMSSKLHGKLSSTDRASSRKQQISSRKTISITHKAHKNSQTIFWKYSIKLISQISETKPLNKVKRISFKSTLDKISIIFIILSSR